MPKHEMMMWLLAGGGVLAGATVSYVATRPVMVLVTSRVQSGWRRARSVLPAMFSQRTRSARYDGMGSTRLASTGNVAFDEYRDQQLSRLEQEAREFRQFLDGLRDARDRQEFDDFLRERKATAPSSPV